MNEVKQKYSRHHGGDADDNDDAYDDDYNATGHGGEDDDWVRTRTTTITNITATVFAQARGCAMHA